MIVWRLGLRLVSLRCARRWPRRSPARGRGLSACAGTSSGARPAPGVIGTPGQRVQGDIEGFTTGRRSGLGATSPRVPQVEREPDPQLVLAEIPHRIVENAAVAILDPGPRALPGEHSKPETESQRVAGLPEAPEPFLPDTAARRDGSVDRELPKGALPGEPRLEVEHVQAGHVGIGDLELPACEPPSGVHERAAAKRHVGARGAIDGGRGAGDADLDGSWMDSRRGMKRLGEGGRTR